MPSNNPARDSLEIEQRAQRRAARRSDPDAELSEALKATFPASDPVAAQAPSTAGAGVLAENLAWVSDETEELAHRAGKRASELQDMLIDEVRARPLRALAWAAAAGALIGFWTAR